MASYSFTKASSQAIAETAIGRAYSLEHTHVALFRAASLPSATNYNSIVGWGSATAAREAVLHLNGDNSGSLAYKVGSTRVLPSTNIVPPTGRWVIGGASKAAGTVTVQFFLYDIENGTWTEFSSSGTVANRTQASANIQIGARQTSEYFDGHIGAVLVLPYALRPGEWRKLAEGVDAWRALQVKPSSFTGGNGGTAGTLCSFVDLTRVLNQFPDEGHRAFAYGTRTAVLAPSVSPNGW